MTKYLLTSFLLFLIGFKTFAQEIQWQNTIGGTHKDELSSVKQTTDGGFILGGHSKSGISGDKTESCLSDYDYWIVKTNASGAVEWDNTIKGNRNDYIAEIIQTADGGYFIGGYSSSDLSGDKTENPKGYFDYWVIKTDSSGTIEWQNTIGGSNYDELRDVQQTSDGGYILGGWSDSGISFDKTENNKGGYDYWIIKLSALGGVQWQNTIGGNADDILYSIRQTSDGGYIMGGVSQSNAGIDKTENNQGARDYWLVKTNSFGNVVWDNTIGGWGFDYMYTVRETSDGGFIIGGYSDSPYTVDKTEPCYGSKDYWILKLDSLGVIEWQNTIGGTGSDELYDIRQTSDGGYILGGQSLSPVSYDKTESFFSSGQYDYWIIKTDYAGNIQWQNTIGGNGNDYFTSLEQTNDGGIIVAGYSSSDISGEKTENDIGFTDYWIVKLTDQYNLIKGELYVDLNSNNIHDPGELPYSNKMLTEVNTGRISFSNSSGQYSLSVLDSGGFSVAVSLVNYFTPNPAARNINFAGIMQTDSLNDFAYQPSGIFNDVCVSINPMGPFRAGFNAQYTLSYNNQGTTALSPTVIFYPDPSVTFISALPAPTSVTPDSVVWAVGSLGPFQSGDIVVTVNVNIGTPIGTLINSGALIEPLAGDANTQCNQSYWEVFTTGSFDPNDILVSQDTLLSTQFPNPPYLDYLIRFQNTGNDTAFTVKVLNEINTEMLDMSTFELLATSHTADISWNHWEHELQFQFNSILLPDSNVNEPESHGFIRYRIKPKPNLVIGNTVKNNAFIYFDFNAAVATNTATTNIILPTGFQPDPDSFGEMLLYPNPATKKITFPLQGIGSWYIYNSLGEIVMTSELKSLSAAPFEVDISGLPEGVYVVKVRHGKSGNDNLIIGRFVKM